MRNWLRFILLTTHSRIKQIQNYRNWMNTLNHKHSLFYVEHLMKTKILKLIFFFFFFLKSSTKKKNSTYHFHRCQSRADKNLVLRLRKPKDFKAHLNAFNKITINWKCWVHYRIKCGYMPMKMCTKQLDIEWLWLKKIRKINGKWNVKPKIYYYYYCNYECSLNQKKKLLKKLQQQRHRQ